jgi:hypothetical protein
MYNQMNLDTRKALVSLCCLGAHCRGDDPFYKTYFRFLPGSPVENKVVVWVRLGNDEGFVMNPEPPSSEDIHCRCVQRMY